MRPELNKLLPEVRMTLLQECANGRTSFGLSWLNGQISPEWLYHGRVPPLCRTKFTSGGLKTHRGLVQRCLTLLAVQGLLYTRRKPECAVASYSHGETDKYFRFRLSKEQALKELARMNVPLQPKTRYRSPYQTKSLS